MVGAEGLKMFEVNTSKLLENIVKALPSHFKFEQTSVLFFWGARVWVLAPHLQYRNLARYILTFYKTPQVAQRKMLF